MKNVLNNEVETKVSSWNKIVKNLKGLTIWAAMSVLTACWGGWWWGPAAWVNEPPVTEVPKNIACTITQDWFKMKFDFTDKTANYSVKVNWETITVDNSTDEVLIPIWKFASTSEATLVEVINSQTVEEKIAVNPNFANVITPKADMTSNNQSYAFTLLNTQDKTNLKAIWGNAYITVEWWNTTKIWSATLWTFSFPEFANITANKTITVKIKVWNQVLDEVNLTADKANTPEADTTSNYKNFW